MIREYKGDVGITKTALGNPRAAVAETMATVHIEDSETRRQNYFTRTRNMDQERFSILVSEYLRIN